MNGGQIVGGNKGNMSVLADQGTMNIAGINAIQANNSGTLLIRSPRLLVAGIGISNQIPPPNPTIFLNNDGLAQVQANTITGSNGASIVASNLDDLEITPFDSNTLKIDPITIIKINSTGDLIFAANKINLNDSLIEISSVSTLDGGNIRFTGNLTDTVPVTTLQMINSIIRNKGTGVLETANNIKFNVSNFEMANSIVQTQTNANDRGGTIPIVNGSQLNSTITYGTIVNGNFVSGGSADWKVVSQLEPDLALGSLGHSTFAATSQYKLSENIRLSATDSVQAAVRGVISQWSLVGRQADLRNNPCEKEGSSLSRTGSGGYAVASSMTLPLPVGYGGAPSRMSYSRAAGFGLQHPVQLADLHRR